VAHRLAALPHGPALDIPEGAIVRALVPGTHEIRWELHASNLSRPVSGALVVSVGPLGHDEPPIAELDVAQRALHLAGAHELNPDPSPEEEIERRAALEAFRAAGTASAAP
jgi:hypothetical protein